MKDRDTQSDASWRKGTYVSTSTLQNPEEHQHTSRDDTDDCRCTDAQASRLLPRAGSPFPTACTKANTVPYHVGPPARGGAAKPLPLCSGVDGAHCRCICESHFDAGR